MKAFGKQSVRSLSWLPICAALASHEGCVQRDYGLPPNQTTGDGPGGDQGGGQGGGRTQAGGNTSQQLAGASVGAGHFGGDGSVTTNATTDAGRPNTDAAALAQQNTSGQAGSSGSGSCVAGCTSNGFGGVAGSNTGVGGNVTAGVAGASCLGEGGKGCQRESIESFSGSSARGSGPGLGAGAGGVSVIAQGGVAATAGSFAAGAGGTEQTGRAGAAGSGDILEPPSCRGLTTKCANESCCASIRMDGGVFSMGRSTAATASDYYPKADPTSWDEIPVHDAKVGPFSLDKYEVTVGRFRSFLENYDAWRNSVPSNPRSGQGENSNVEIGLRSATGWSDEWTASELPADSESIRQIVGAHATASTWTNDPAAGHEAFPINFVTWYMAFAFCIWDEARLPTEAEWEFAAAGGADDCLFPWCNTQEPLPANYVESGYSPRIAVGSYADGAGAFGHRDLAGSMWEWVLDWYSPSYYGSAESPLPCINCVNTDVASVRVIRGGGWYNEAIYLRAASRSSYTPNGGHDGLGFRCARSIPNQ